MANSVDYLPILGMLNVPVRLMHLEAKDKDGKSIPDKFFQSGFCFFRMADSVADVSGPDGEDLGTIGGCMGGHMEADIKLKDKGLHLYMIVNVEEMWAGFNKVANDQMAKDVIDNMETIYKEYWKDYTIRKDAKENEKAKRKAAEDAKREAERKKIENLKEKKQKEYEKLQRQEEERERKELEKKKKEAVKSIETWIQANKSKTHKPYKVCEYEIINDNGWDLNFEMPENDMAFVKQDLKIPINMGCGIKLINRNGEARWTSDKNEDNIVKVEWHSWKGTSMDAIHYYGKFVFDMPHLTHIMEDGRECFTTTFDIKLLGRKEIDLVRYLKSWEKREYPGRWDGYRLEFEDYPSEVNAWYSLEDLKKKAEEVFPKIFGEGWKLDLSEVEE